MWPLNSPELNPLGYTMYGEMLEVYHMHHPAPKISPNSRKCCHRQSNSGYGKQSWMGFF